MFWFWICAGNSVDNSGMFQSLLSSAYPAQRLSYPTNKRLGEHKNLGGSTATTADLRSIPDYMASFSVYKVGGEGERGDIQRNGVSLLNSHYMGWSQ